MTKWIHGLLSFLLIVGAVSIPDSFRDLKPALPKEAKGEEFKIVLAQVVEREGKKEDTDRYLILILKQVREKVDSWLKSLNERIEREDVTRFEVRFLEILRSILEWVKEKIDSKIDSYEEEKEEKREKEDLPRETKLRGEEVRFIISSQGGSWETG